MVLQQPFAMNKNKATQRSDISEISFQLPHEVNNLDVLKHLLRTKEESLEWLLEVRDDQGAYGLGSSATVGTVI